MVTLQPSPLALQLSLYTQWRTNFRQSASTNYICLNFCISYHAIHVASLTGYRSGCRMLQFMYNSNCTIYNNLKIHIAQYWPNTSLPLIPMCLACCFNPMLAWKLFRPKYELESLADQAERMSEIILQSDQPDLSNSFTRLLNYQR